MIQKAPLASFDSCLCTFGVILFSTGNVTCPFCGVLFFTSVLFPCISEAVVSTDNRGCRTHSGAPK